MDATCGGYAQREPVWIPEPDMRFRPCISGLGLV
jgi:hypothetical protein